MSFFKQLVPGTLGERQKEMQSIVDKRADLYLRNGDALPGLLNDAVEAEKLLRRHAELSEYFRKLGRDDLIVRDRVKAAGKAAGRDVFMLLLHAGVLEPAAINAFQRQVATLRKGI